MGLTPGYAIFIIRGLERPGLVSHECRHVFQYERQGSMEEFLHRLHLDDPGAGLAVVDEIGKMECLSGVFVQLVEDVLASGKPLLATVAQKGGRIYQGGKVKTGRRAGGG